MNSKKNVSVEVWSEITCPFCPVGEVRLQKALNSLSDSYNVEVLYRSFRLLPGKIPRSVSEIAAEKHGSSPSDSIARTVAVGASEGLQYNAENLVAGDTMDAHRLVHLAATQGLAQKMIRRLYAAHFTDQKNIFDRQTLLLLAAEIGLDKKTVADMLDSKAFIEEVIADEAKARAIGIRSVPTILINGEMLASGTQSPEETARSVRAYKSQKVT